MAKKGKDSKHKSKSKSKSSTRTVGRTVGRTPIIINVNTNVSQETARERVKQIRSRKRPNLRQMRNGMGGLTAANLRQPNFFGNTAMLTNAAMAAMNNKAYATERQLLDMKSQVSAQQQDGRQIADSQQQTIQALQNELAVTRAFGQAAHQRGQQQVASTRVQGQTQQADDLMGMQRGAFLQRVAQAAGVSVSEMNVPRLTERLRRDLISKIQANDKAGILELIGPTLSEPEPEPEPESQYVSPSPSFASASRFDRDSGGVSAGDFNISRRTLGSMISQDPLSPEEIEQLGREKLQLARKTEAAGRAIKVADELQSTPKPLLPKNRKRHAQDVERIRAQSSQLQQDVSRTAESIRQKELRLAQARGYEEGQDQGSGRFNIYDLATSSLRPGSPPTPQTPFSPGGGG